MKLLYFIKGLGLGGAERHVVSCAKEFKRRGYQVTVAYMVPEKNALVEELENNGISVVLLEGRGALRQLFSLYKLLKLFCPEIVHSHLPIPGTLSRILKSQFDYKLIYTEHNMYKRLNPLSRFFHSLTRRIDDTAISCSQPVRDSLPWASTTIDNGIEVPDFPPNKSFKGRLRSVLGISNTDTVFICIANLLAKKNHKLLLNAFELAFNGHAGSDAHLVLVGQDGTERDNLQTLVSSFQTQERVHFWGSDPKAVDLLHESDVFCLSSRFEGLPIALLESMAFGLPAVVTNVGGMPGAVQDGVTGFVIESGNTEKYAEALITLHKDTKLRAKMGQSAHQLALTKYSQERMFDELERIYNS